MNKKLALLSTIVFFGALWGVLEATLGYVLHLIPVPFLAGSIMFPLATLVLLYAYKHTQSRKALLAVGVIAASIKALNFFMPMNHWGIINPMISIVLESLMVVALANFLVSRNLTKQALGFLTASVAWRGAYLVWFAVQFAATGFLAEQIGSFGNVLTFAVFQGLFSGALAFALYKGFELLETRSALSLRIHPLGATFMLTLATVLTVIL